MSEQELVRALLEKKAKLEAFQKRWTPHSKQKEIIRAIFNDGYKRVFIMAGRKFGKTEIAMYIAGRVAALKPSAAAYIIGPTRKQEAEILWQNGRLQSFLPDFGQTVRDSDYRIIFPNKSFIKIDGSENHQSYRGTQYDVMIIDEFADSDPRFYAASYPNLLARGGVLVIIGTAPYKEGPYTKLADEWKKRKDAIFFTGSSWDNDRLPDGKEWLEAERKEYHARGEFREWEIEFEGKFIPGGAGAVFPNFDTKKHVFDHQTILSLIYRDRHKMQWFVTADPGTTSVFGGLFIAYNPYTASVYVLDEIYEKDQGRTHSMAIRDTISRKKEELWPGSPEHKWTYIYDEAAAWFRQEMAQHDMAFIPSIKAYNEKSFGISMMRSMMARKNTFLVSEKCKNFIWEMQNYAVLPNGTIPDKDDHCIDPFRYFLGVSGYQLNESQLYYDGDPGMGKRVYTPEDDISEKTGLASFDFELDNDFDYMMIN